MKHTFKFLLLFIMLNAMCLVKAQSESPMDYLERAFPQLTELFYDELSNYPAHYIFAVDVSGTMKRYDPMVVSALTPFFQALPDNDRVDVIPFGTDAKISMFGYSGVVDNNVKNTLCSNIKTLYTNQSYSREFKAHTDIKSAVDGIAKVIQNNREYKVNVVVVITDFRNDQLGAGECRLKSEALKSMKSAVKAATGDVYTRFIALELPVNREAPGYCLDQLRDEVFLFDDKSLEITPITDDAAMIGQWFNQLKRDIMTTKLKAIVQNANKNTPVDLDVQKDIDGNVLAKIQWTPSKLYPTIQIDSTYIDGGGFYFVNNTENFTKTRDSVIEVELGQIKHQEWGFHNLVDDIHLGLLLPTPYDDELASLEAEKPLPKTTVSDPGMIFTFFLTFKTTVIIIVLIILYIIGIFMAIKRNAKLRFKGNVTFYDANGAQIGEMVRMPEQSSPVITVGKGGTGRCNVSGADWQFVIQKKKGNPFLLFVKPRFVWRSTLKYVAQGKKKSGDVNSSLLVTCGTSANDLTHKVRISGIPSL